MKIAIFSGTIPSSAFIENLIKHVACSHEVQLYGVVSKQTKYKSDNIKIYKTPFSHVTNLSLTIVRCLHLLIKRPKDLIKLFKEVRKYKRVYDKWIWFSKYLPIILYKPDIFHMQWARDMEFYTFLKTKFNIPIIVSLRGSHINYTPIVQPRIAEIYKQTFIQVDAFHAVSMAIAFETQKYGVNSGKIEVIHSPIPKEVWEVKNHQPDEKKALKIISVGRFHWVKGYKYALSAIELLKQKGVQVKYTIVATNQITEDVRFQIHQLGLVNEVEIRQGIPQKELFKFMQQFNMLLLPSLEEGIANVVLEAMALGVPVISTDCGGMSEVVKHKLTGLLVPIRDPKAIAQAINDCNQLSQDELTKMTRAAQNLIKTEFDTQQSINRFLELYKRVHIKNSK